MPTFANNSKMPSIQGTGNSGSFLRQAQLIGQLSIITPIKVEVSTYKPGTSEERETKKLIADVVVLTGLFAGSHPGVWLSGGKLIELGSNIIDQKLDSVIAGRMERKPLKKYREFWPTSADLEAAIADPKVLVASNAYSWLVPNPSAEDLALIQEYYATGAVPAADDADGADPFDD